MTQEYAYQYCVGYDAAPLVACPRCGADLTGDAAVLLRLVVGERELAVTTRLSRDGRLIDVDRAVAHGYHSRTDCGTCGTALINNHDVIEHQFEID